jgi:hypothetical protein
MVKPDATMVMRVPTPNRVTGSPIAVARIANPLNAVFVAKPGDVVVVMEGRTVLAVAVT